MGSTVKTRPNHYETLGISPNASGDDIVRAFAREIGVLRPRAFGGVGEVSVAYETLRDPARRRAYDVSIGLRAEPEPPSTSPSETYRISHFIAATARIASDRPIADLLPPRTTTQAALPVMEPKPVTPPLPTEPIKAEPKAPARQISSLPGPEHLDQDHESGAIAWKRPAMIGAGAIAAVGLIGAWAGIESSNDVQEATPKQAATTLALPPASPLRVDATPARAEPAPVTVEKRSRPIRAVSAGRTRTAPPSKLGRPLSEEEIAELAPVEVAQGAPPTEAANEPAAAEVARAEVVPAKLPLPNSVIARTIGRIGYACGSVASATALEGEAPGTFKVTCTSGHSYRAAPVHGRYHFRKLGSQ